LLEREGKALIDMVDGLSSGSVVLISVTDGDLADHDAHLGGGAAKRLPGRLIFGKTFETHGYIF
jgi:hypothetical protein